MATSPFRLSPSDSTEVQQIKIAGGIALQRIQDPRSCVESIMVSRATLERCEEQLKALVK